MDVFLYSGAMRRGDDLSFIEFVNKNKTSESVLLVLVSFGGDPDAAYKIGKYLQQRYDDFQVLVPGLCKSAGTLLAIAAREVIFTPYGELGPLDIQLTKPDQIAAMESGLSILQALDTLQGHAQQTYHNLVQEIVSITGGVVSFHTASHSAAEMVTSLYGPIFSKIDPEEVGSRTRAMQIAAAYGQRLNLKFRNVKPEALDMLAQTYPSHSFVIDLEEAENILNVVRIASIREKKLVQLIGKKARFPPRDLAIDCLTVAYAAITDEDDNEDENPTEQHQAGDHPISGVSEDNEGHSGAADQGSITGSDDAPSALGEGNGAHAP
jgi:hypothetical protein